MGGSTCGRGGVRKIRLWRSDSGGLLRTIGGQSQCVCALAWSPDGKIIAASSDDGSAKLWNIGSGSLLRTLPGHPNSVESLAWSPDGRTLASGSYDHSVKLWNTASGTFARSLSGHRAKFRLLHGGRTARCSRPAAWMTRRKSGMHLRARSCTPSPAKIPKILITADFRIP